MAKKRDTKEDEKVLLEAQKRFDRCAQWEDTARTLFVEDTKFCEGDSDNLYQWEKAIQQKRTRDARPCLTINKTRQHCLQIVNDARQNKAAVSVKPVGDGATYEAAQVFEGIIRHIEYISNATEAYESAAWRQVTGGWGYWRILTDFIDDKSFDQEIYIRRVPDPLSVYLDPDIQQFDGSDAKFGFVFKDMTRAEFDVEYPDYKDEATSGTLGDYNSSPIQGWDDSNNVRIAEYYRKSDKKDELLYLATGEIVLKSDMPKEVYEAMPDEAVIRRRATTRPEIEWFKLVGRCVLERKIWPGQYIPLVRVVGEETVIDGKLDRKGHTRALKDPQRMYNYWSSSATEHVALQSKTPYIATNSAVEGFEEMWANANTENYAYLPYNHMDEQGRVLPAPARQAAPTMSQAYMAGMHNAQQEMMMASGQYQSSMGENENAKSGIAIQTRERQGDNATYHYIDHLAQAIRYTGRILIDLIPKIYDTPRVIKIMAESGEQTEVHIDPDAPESHQNIAPGPNGQMAPITPEQAKAAQNTPDMAKSVKTIFNPAVGTYFVQADVGPAFGTKRQEQFNALTQMMSHNPDLMKVAGDLMFAAADFPMSDELQERFKRTIPPAILGKAPPPELQQAQQHIQQMQAMIQKLTQTLVDRDSKLAARGDKDEIATYDSETRRLAVIGQNDPDGLRLIIRGMLADMLGMDPLPAIAGHARAEAAMLPQAPAMAPQEFTPAPQG